MDEQMIADIVRAIGVVLAERHGGHPDAWINDETYEEARAAHSVIAGKVAELEGALRDALDMVVDATRDGTYSVSEFAALRAALAPYPERRSEHHG